MKPVLAFTLGAQHPSSRLRIAAYADHFRRLGWDLQSHHFHPGIGKAAPRNITRRLHRGWQTIRATVALRRIPPNQPIIISRELPVSRRAFLNAPNPIILDIDDALYLGTGRERLFELCQRAQVVICGNQTIADELSKHSRRCLIIPTVVGSDSFRVRTDYRLNGVLRLGWLGSSMSIEQTLLPFLNVFDEIRRQIPFQLVVISDEPPRTPSFDWLQFIPWSPDVEESVADYMDIGVMPLQDNPYQRAKCGAKILQYMAAGLPVIATPIGVNREIVVDGVTGLHATTSENWRQAIRRLAGQEILRAALGQAGRKFVVQNFSIAKWADRWVALLNELT